MAYRNSRPFKKLISFIEKLGIKDDNNKSEFDILENVISELYDSKEQLNNEVHVQKNVAKTGIMERLIRYGIYTNEDLKMAEDYFPNIPQSYYFALLEFSLVENDSEGESKYKVDVYIVIILRLIKEEFSDDVITHATGKNNIIIIIPDKGQEKEELYSKLTTLQQKLTNSFNGRIVCGVSSKYSGMTHLIKAFNEVEKAIRYGRVEKKSSIIFYEQTKKGEDGIVFDYYDGQKLFQLILAGEKGSIIILVNNIVAINKDFISKDSIASQQLFYMLRGIILSARKELQNIEIKMEIVDYSDEVLPETLFNELINYCIAICDEIGICKRSHNNILKESVIKYIYDNYSNQAISAADIASKFNVTEKYVFNFIKEQKGYSLGDYIESIRMENAIKLIKETNMTINQVAQEVGYLSQNTFYKAFKRLYGRSPSSLRENDK